LSETCFLFLLVASFFIFIAEKRRIKITIPNDRQVLGEILMMIIIVMITILRDVAPRKKKEK